MGRNMFGPVRGPWPDDSWKGWWGENPPYHVPVFVLTHHARAPLTMDGGTTFHFVTDGIQAALERAKEAAQGKDVRLGGGTSTIRQYLTAGLIDELHLVISPVLLGRGEHLLGLGDVGNERKGLAADPLDLRPRAFQALAAPRQEGDAPSAPRKRQRGCAADPGRRSGDDDYGC